MWVSFTVIGSPLSTHNDKCCNILFWKTASPHVMVWLTYAERAYRNHLWTMGSHRHPESDCRQHVSLTIITCQLMHNFEMYACIFGIFQKTGILYDIGTILTIIPQIFFKQRNGWKARRKKCLQVRDLIWQLRLDLLARGQNAIWFQCVSVCQVDKRRE